MNQSRMNQDSSSEARVAPAFDVDLYSDEGQGNLHEHAARMRAASPVVWLSKHDVYYVTTYNGVRRCLNSWEEFSSLGGRCEMILASVGPINARFEQAVANVQQAGSPQWSERMSRRESLTPSGFGADLYAAVDAGEITADEAALMVSLFLFGGVDTTITSLANGIRNFIDHPDQWSLLSNEPALAKEAFEEVVRFNVPVQQMYRNVARTAVVDGVQVEEGKRIGLSIAAANRDPAKFSDPDRFDIRRKPMGHFGFGAGIHGCAGQVVARLEAQALFSALARYIDTLELAGEPERWISGGLASWKAPPVVVRPKARSAS